MERENGMVNVTQTQKNKTTCSLSYVDPSF